MFTFQLLYAKFSFWKCWKTLLGKQAAAYINMRLEIKHCMITEENTEMEEKHVKTENRQELNLDQMQQVSGGVGEPEKRTSGRYIVVACDGCGKHITITSETTEYICSCGYKNTFFG